MYSRDGMKAGYTFHRLTSTRLTLTDTPGVTCTPRRSGVLLHGKPNISLHHLSTRIHLLKNYWSSFSVTYLLLRRCDRILWHGGGLHQLSYVRGESRFSDHRPVYSLFYAEVELVNTRFRKSYSSSRIEVEELLPYSHGYTELSFF